TERGERRDDQDVAAALDDVGERGVRGPEYAGEVDVDDPLEGRRVDLADGAVRRDPGVGHHDVDAAELVDDLGDDPIGGVLVGDVELPPGVLRAELGGQLREALGLQSGQRQASPPAGEN